MKLLRVRQELVSNPIADIPSAVREALDRAGLDVPRGELAITAGSRGVRNFAAILRAAGQWLRDHGARPFVIPAMGTHNGGTAEGQIAMLASLGVTESSVGMPIRASMECVKIGAVGDCGLRIADCGLSGKDPNPQSEIRDPKSGDVWMDRHAYESAGVLVVNRIKLHTCFSGPVQSGLSKMMVVGMGKIGGARTFHSTPTPQLSARLAEMRQIVLGTGKIWAGLAILEDGYDQTAELHAVRAEEIAETEPRLLERHREYFPRLPLDELNVLVVDTIGKNFSGTGMDTNVIGYRGVRDGEDLASPFIHVIAALRLSPESQGNAIGVGLADFITRPLRDAIDEQKTFLNSFTTGHMGRVKIPITFRDDEELFSRLAERYGEQGWMVIPNTLQLNILYASPNLRDALAANPICRVGSPVEVAFASGRHQLPFDGG
jgi:hypothetical protein